MIIKKRSTLAAATGIALSLAFAAAPLQAQGTADDVQADPTVPDADGTAMTAEEVEMAAEKAGEKMEEGAEAVEEGAEAMAEDAGEMAEDAEVAVEGAMDTAADALDDSEMAAKLQQDIGTDPRFGSYGIEVTDIDGRYTVTGMIDKSEDYTALQEMLNSVEGIDPAMIDNNVVQN